MWALASIIYSCCLYLALDSYYGDSHTAALFVTWVTVAGLVSTQVLFILSKSDRVHSETIVLWWAVTTVFFNLASSSYRVSVIFHGDGNFLDEHNSGEVGAIYIKNIHV